MKWYVYEKGKGLFQECNVYVYAKDHDDARLSASKAFSKTVEYRTYFLPMWQILNQYSINDLFVYNGQRKGLLDFIQSFITEGKKNDYV